MVSAFHAAGTSDSSEAATTWASGESLFSKEVSAAPVMSPNTSQAISPASNQATSAPFAANNNAASSFAFNPFRRLSNDARHSVATSQADRKSTRLNSS